MDAQASKRRITILMMTEDPGLLQLARSILGPDREVTGGAAPLAHSPDVVVIDLASPIPQDIDAVRRDYSGAALIALFPQHRETDCIAALEMDADYLAYPFSDCDFASRVRVAELRRFSATGRPRFYRNGRLAFDAFSRTLSISDRPVALSPLERSLFAQLARRPGGVVPYERLLAETGLSASPRGRGDLQSCVYRLRRKIEREPLHPRILLSEPRIGYRLAPPAEDLSRRARDCLPNDRK